MKKLLSSDQMRAADAYTIEAKDIESVDLMEQASLAFVKLFGERYTNRETTIAVLCGRGNNGGDGLAIARLLKNKGYNNIEVYLITFSEKESEDYKINLKRLEDLWFRLHVIENAASLTQLNEEIVIDAILGSGLNAPLSGEYQKLALAINAMQKEVVAVDVPTGFPSEGIIEAGSTFLQADLVICFQRPKINFFFPESAKAMKTFEVADIGLDEAFIQTSDSVYSLLESADIKDFVKPRALFSHKGTYGHALIIAGQPQTMGAALLSARACLHMGAGLTTLSIPATGLTALNTSLPEVMYLDRDELAKIAADKFKAIAVGPGLGTTDDSLKIMETLIGKKQPLVIDADGINILAQHQELLMNLAPGSIITPHMKEFDHLFGSHSSWWERLETARIKAKELNITILLKNQYTFIVSSGAEVRINPTGNPSMAQGGMGDILTGMIVSLMAQGYDSLTAASIGCYIHGMAGDELAEHSISVSASNIADHVTKTLKGLIK